MGSFINALVWRIHVQEVLTEKSAKISKNKESSLQIPTPNYSVFNGRSMCPNCKHLLSAKDLIPVISWISLKGKCRYCKKLISWQYPLIELLTALLFILSWVFWPITLNVSWQYLVFITWLVILVGLIAMAIYDAKWMLLPDKIMYPLILIVIGSYICQFALGKPPNDLSGILISVAIGCGFFAVIYFVSKGKWIGFGDVKLGLLLGLIVATPINIFITLFLSSVLGVIWILPLLITKRLKPTSHVPFGPFLIVAATIVVFFGQNIVDLYRSFILI